MSDASFASSGHLRRVATLVALPLVAVLHWGSWYAYRSVSYLLLSERGWALEDVGVAFAASTSGTLVGFLLGALLAAAVGGRVASALAGVAMAAALGVLPVVPDSLVTGCLVAAGGAHGAVSVGVLSAAVDAFPRPLEAGRAATVALVYACINSGALLSVAASSTASLSPATVLFTAAGLAVLGAPLLVPLVFLPPGPPEHDPTTRVHLPSLVGSLGLLVFLLFPIALRNHGMAQQWFALDYATGGTSPWWIGAVNPAAIMISTGPLVLVLLVLASFRIRVVELLPLGVGLVLTALSGVAFALPAGTLPLPALTIAVVVAAMAELLVSTFAISRVAGDLHWRLVPLFIGVWQGGTYGGSWLIGAFLPQDHSSPGGTPAVFLWFTVLVVLLCGAAALIAAIPLHRLVWSDEWERGPADDEREIG